MTKILSDYELLKQMNLAVRTNKITMSENNKCIIFVDKIYDTDKKLIKYESKFNEEHNVLHIFTGELHGGYIGIDIDCKKI